MKNVNEHSFEDIRRKKINLVADNFLSNQDEGDNFDAYLKLLEESEKGNDDCQAADYVKVWQPLEHLSVAVMIETIENAVINPEMPEFIKKIDFITLRSQKTSLLAVIENLKDIKFQQAFIDDLDGILNLIDTIQDAAVDDYGLDENLVFSLHPEK